MLCPFGEVFLFLLSFAQFRDCFETRILAKEFSFFFVEKIV